MIYGYVLNIPLLILYQIRLKIGILINTIKYYYHVLSYTVIVFKLTNKLKPKINEH